MHLWTDSSPVACALAACLWLVQPSFAQSESIPQHDVGIDLDSGLLPTPTHASPLPEIVFSQDVRVPGAAWLRLWFSGTTLPGDPAANGAFLRLTSLDDGATQHLDAQSLARWSMSSAYFNGDAIRVELFAFSNTGSARVAISHASVGDLPPYADRSICGPTDDRVPSSDPRTARQIVVGVNSPCTVWLIDDPNRSLLTAGHCDPRPPSVIQFNCPLSDSLGIVRHPPPSDQYPIDASSPQTVNGGIGNDFSYFGTFPNTETGRTAYQAQQTSFRLATSAPPSTEPRNIRITGYGATIAPISPTWNFAQKTHVGPYAGFSGTTVRYATDSTGGNSGSAIEDLLTGLAIGIHTHAGCTNTGSSNQGTAIQLAAIQFALANPRGVCLSGRAPVANSTLFLAGDINNTVGALDPATGLFATTLSQDAGLVRLQGLAADQFGHRLFALADDQLLFPLGSPFQVAHPLTNTLETLNGLAFDQQTRTLYAIAQASGQLYQLSMNGVATPIGTPAGGRVGALEFDNDRRVLFGLDDTDTGTFLVQINTSTGAQSTVGPLGGGLSDCNGLAYSDALYTVDAVTRNLYRINPDTGAASLVGPTRALFGASFGMAGFDPRPHCFADVNSDGGVTIDDLLLFLSMYSQGELGADIDDGTATETPDGGVTIDDLLRYLVRFEEGC